MNLILIPVYNDWKSLNKLLIKINNVFSNLIPTKILIVDDCSNIRMIINKKKLNNIKKIEIMRLKKNVGSQKAIAIGLKYIHKKKRDFNYVTVMDGDGEDNPEEIIKMFNLAKKHKDAVVVSCRKDRNENFLIKSLYKIHLIITFFLTFHWMNFGNFSVFFYKNLESLFLNNNIYHAYSAAVKKNTIIKRTYATRLKRFYGESKVNLFFLLAHSIRIMGVFYKRIVIFSLIYIYLLIYLNFNYSIFFSLLIILFNCIILILLSKSEINYHNVLKLKIIKL